MKSCPVAPCVTTDAAPSVTGELKPNMKGIAGAVEPTFTEPKLGACNTFSWIEAA